MPFRGNNLCHILICSQQHFEENCYRHCQSRFLNRNAVPSLNRMTTPAGPVLADLEPSGSFISPPLPPPFVVPVIQNQLTPSVVEVFELSNQPQATCTQHNQTPNILKVLDAQGDQIRSFLEKFPFGRVEWKKSINNIF